MTNQLLLRPREAAKMLGVSRATLYRLADDPTFPQRVRLTAQCVAWRADELCEWIEIRKFADLLGLPVAARRDEHTQKKEPRRSAA